MRRIGYTIGYNLARQVAVNPRLASAVLTDQSAWVDDDVWVDNDPWIED